MACDTAAITFTRRAATRLATSQYELAQCRWQQAEQDECHRRQRITHALAAAETDALHSSAIESERCVERCQEEIDHSAQIVARLEHDRGQAQARVQAQEREILVLKTEIAALQHATTDLERVLTEKLALARELATLKPQFEHLSTQSQGYQQALAEKLSLQRKVDDLQAELEQERRTVQRRGQVQQQHDSQLETRVATLETELASERLARQRYERQANEAGAKQSTLETRVDTLRSKLRLAQTQLKATDRRSEPGRRPRGGKASPPSRSAIVAVDTPEATGPSQPANRSSLRPDQKSSFSVTPFLNRTTHVTFADSPLRASIIPEETETSASDARVADPSKSDLPKYSAPSSALLPGLTVLQQPRAPARTESRKRRRLLGNQSKPTLFDEDEETDGLKGPQAANAGPAWIKKGRSLLPKGQTAFSNASRTFSPLKRDRRATVET